MTTQTVNRSIEKIENGEWLSRLLDDIQKDILRQPTKRAVFRIRNRLFRQMDAPVRAAA
jgi:hypothetical protein